MEQDPAGKAASDHAKATAVRGGQPYIRVESSGQSTAIGVVYGPVTITQQSVRSPARFSYLHRVRQRIAPPSLIGREQELAELARFCLEPGCGPYTWWQGEAWAGKTALLSTFVLNPPPAVREHVEIVSFFITGLQASQDTRDTFTRVLLLQLAQLTGQALPDEASAEGIQEDLLLDLLDQAARACQESGKRLVLVVDGLDEDQGVTGAVHGHSIAALLPADPPYGMRVIVAGRPNPPVPKDVPGWHPLKDPAIVRPLPAFEGARDRIQLPSEWELRRLLDRNPVERDLLGILTAARGGLSHEDLSELMGAPYREPGVASRAIGKVLATVAGRTFTRHAGLLAPGTGPEVYLLSHIELRRTAERELGEDLPGYRDQIHRWAEGYREKGWPSGTPEYLITEYFQLLKELGDLPRMITHATDQARHDRMLGMTGADAPALAETRIALERIAGQHSPALDGALMLAVHRDYLTDRNVSMPVNLPAAWACLGHAARAETLAYSITEPRSRALALAKVAQALAKAGHYQQASALAEAAESQTGLRADAYGRSGALTETANALAQAGQYRNAESVAHSIGSPLVRAQALAHVAVALVKSGQHQHAADLASEAEVQVHRESHPDVDQERAEVAWTLGSAELHRQAEMIERSITSQGWQPEAPARRASAVARTGQHGQAERTALSITDSYWQARALAEIVRSLAETGHHEHAEAVACAITPYPPPWRVEALTHATRAWIRDGEQQRALGLAKQAAEAARSISPRYDRGRALTKVAGIVAETGQHEVAATIAQEAAKHSAGLEDLTDIARVLAEAGERRHSTELAERAEDGARSSGGHRHLVSWDGHIRCIAETLAEVRHQDAETVAFLITDRGKRADAVVRVARTFAEAGEHDRALAVVRRAEADARSARNSWGSGLQALAASAFACAGEYEHAQELADSITHPRDQLLALTQISAALTKTGDQERAVATADHAARVAHSMRHGSYERALSLAQAARALGNAGARRRAAAVAAAAEKASHSLDYLPQLGRIAETLAGDWAHQQVTAIAVRIETLARTRSDAGRVASIPGGLAEIACFLAKAGAREQATATAVCAEALAYTTASRDIMDTRGVVRALAEVGMYQRADEFARSVSPQHGRANLLAEIALALARSGSLQSAEAAENLISRPDLPSAEDLASLSEALLKSGNTDIARRVAIATCAAGPTKAGVLTLGSWTVVARPILLLDHAAAPVAVSALKRWIAKPHSPEDAGIRG
jgi:hypothetical protein